jgi:hypothetical protein
MLGVTLLALLVAAIARQDLPAAEGRAASLGLALLCLGLLHLMLRRDAQRAMVAFATLGMGIQVLEHVAAGARLPGDPGRPWLAAVATAIAVTLAARLATIREQDAGSTWVSDAHDLHD